MVLPWRSSRIGEAKRHSSVVETKIPTPEMPLTPRGAAESSRRLVDAVARENIVECLEIVNKIKNKQCLVQNGVVSSLSTCFDIFAARDSHVDGLRLLTEVLSVLSSSSVPLNRSEGFSKMGSTASLNRLVRFLNGTDAKTRENAAFCIREVVAIDKRYVYTLMEIEGACEGLVHLIRDSISIKSALMAIYRSISCDKKIFTTRFVELNLVELITEMIVNNEEKSVCERALVTLNLICDNEQGREDVLRNDLIVPLLVKKILRVSDLATQCSISILWKLWKNQDDRLLGEALQVGAFEKLLVVLQIGCEVTTKEKASELLRNLNLRRNEIEKTNCVDSSMNLKYVKKSF